MKQATICFPIRGSQILLGMKKQRPDRDNFGVGKWNGFGGKQEPGEMVREAALRELKEESGLVAEEKDLEEVAHIIFFEDEKLISDCVIFFLKTWRGDEQESDEMTPRWFEMTKIPYHHMWVDDILWIPFLLAGKKIDATVRLKSGMKEVESFQYTERKI